MTGHLLIIGETQSGKSYLANKIHQEFPEISIYWNTNHVPYVWGEKVASINGLAQVLTRSKKINFLPAHGAAGIAQLDQLVQWLFRHGKGAGRQWCQLLVDEAQEYSRETSNATQDPVRLVATRGLGAYGIRLVCITQYPVTLNTTTRTNCAFRIIFRPGIEGAAFLQNKGYPIAEIDAWTAQKYHWASYTPERGWAYHKPI